MKFLLFLIGLGAGALVVAAAFVGALTWKTHHQAEAYYDSIAQPGSKLVESLESRPSWEKIRFGSCASAEQVNGRVQMSSASGRFEFATLREALELHPELLRNCPSLNVSFVAPSHYRGAIQLTVRPATGEILAASPPVFTQEPIAAPPSSLSAWVRSDPAFQPVINRASQVEAETQLSR